MPDPPVAAPEDSRILRGRLADLPLADILQFLHASGKSGALFLRRDDGPEAILVFRNGGLIQAVRTDAHQTLGTRLQTIGSVTKERLEEALAYRARFPGMRIGDALVDLGVLPRETVEAEVERQMAETLSSLMSWDDADFEFRIGIVSAGRGLPDFAVDLVLDREVEPRRLLMQAAMIEDDTTRGRRARAATPAPTPAPPAEEDDEVARKIVRWFDPTAEGVDEGEDLDRLKAADTYLSLSEELFAAQERGEMGLLLLRYASDFFDHGALVLRVKKGYRVLGQFGEEVPTFSKEGESPLFDLLCETGQPYYGPVSGPPSHPPAPAAEAGPGGSALAVPLLVLGRVSLVLFCRKPMAGIQDTRALVALSRQVALAIENLALREIARRKAATEAP